MKFKSILLGLPIFICIGLLLTAVPEWQNNILINGAQSGWPGYIHTLKLNAILLIISYFIFSFLRKKYSPQKTILLLFTIWGITGLLFEWFLINHPPGSGAIQYTMFVYWGVVFSAPALFLLEKTKHIRARLLIFILVTAALLIPASYLVLSMANLLPTSADVSAGDWGLVVLSLFITTSWALIYSSILNYFLLGFGYVSKRKSLIGVAIIVPLLEMVVPFPFNFLLFIVVILLGYWYLLKKLPRGHN